MRSTHNAYAPKEDTKNMLSVGKPFTGLVKYNKDDFLTPGLVAKKFNISIEMAKKLMKQLKMRNASFVLNGHKAQVIVDFHKGSLYLHPMGIEVFAQQLSKQKD